MAVIKCISSPVINVKAGVQLTKVGDTADVELTHFWQGMIERGAVEIVEAIEADAPEVDAQYTIGDKTGTVTKITDKGVLVDTGGKRPWFIPLEKWSGVKVKTDETEQQQ